MVDQVQRETQCATVYDTSVSSVIHFSNNSYIKCKQNIQGWIPIWIPKGWKNLADLTNFKI